MLWKLREFRRLLNLIEGLPSTSHLTSAIANDDEYMREIVERHGGLPKGKVTGPSLTEWTQEVAKLATIIDLLKANNTLLIKINSKPGSQTPSPEPEPRPETAWARVSLEVRMSKHRDLARRLLGDRTTE